MNACIRIVLSVTALFVTVQAYAGERPTGFYLQISPPLFSYVFLKGQLGLGGTAFPLSVGYDLNRYVGLELNISAAAYQDMDGFGDDPISWGIEAEGLYYPLGQETLNPFVQLGVGLATIESAGIIQDHSYNHVLLDFGAGVLWSISRHNGLMFRVSDAVRFIQETGTLNELRLSLVYRWTF